jgi:hypothetical protein
MISFHCDHGRKHAWLSLDKTGGLAVYAGPCECGGNSEACTLLQVNCVDCSHMERAREAVHRPLEGKVVEQDGRWTLAYEHVGEPESKGRHKGSRTHLTMISGNLGEMKLIERAAGQALLDAEERAPKFTHAPVPSPTQPCVVAFCGRVWPPSGETSTDPPSCPVCQRVLDSLPRQ